MLVGVVGLGYLGTTHAVALAKLGHEVVGIDLNLKRIDSLTTGKVPFHEPGLEEALGEALSRRLVSFQASFDATKVPEVIFVCVGTPQADTGTATDTSFVFSAGERIAEIIARDTVVVGKSTVPLGTAALLRDRMSKVAGFPVNLAWNPEFLREGTALEDTLKPDRIVVGSWDHYSASRLKEVYRMILDQGTPLIEVNVETAELVKVAANAFLATKVSFINAMAEIAEVSGADAVHLAAALGYDERIGDKFLKSGIGFGGGCLPKDIRGFAARANELGVGEAVEFLKDVDSINQRRRAKVFQLAEQELGELGHKRVLILGLSFKPQSDDIRDSPALEIARRLAQAGAVVTVHDPVSLPALGDRHPELMREQDLQEAARDQELVILGTEWAEYTAIGPVAFGQMVANKVIIDGRNVLDVALWQAAGWRIIALGRNVHN